MFLFGGRFLECVLEDRSYVTNPLAAGRAGAGKNDSPDEIRPFVCNYLRNEAA